MYAKGKGSTVPSDAQAREKLALYVYEYLLHVGAQKAAQTFLSEIRWEKNITLGEPPGFLHSWWCVFWDLYSAAPERRETCEHSSEAKAFHDYGFVNSGYAVNGIAHNPTAPSPLGQMPPNDGMPGGPMPPGFFPNSNMRPSPPQHPANQPSPHPQPPPHSQMMQNQGVYMLSCKNCACRDSTCVNNTVAGCNSAKVREINGMHYDTARNHFTNCFQLLNIPTMLPY
ncbi:hypothetical protein JTE90_004331 [Oedothorax gibbosus]|uniref:Single-stranded DNA-binding protein 3 n=1 Tax=Oedothorax gibbosus TaxID=931172 RepID=A0AAV6VMA7_9ARAC|nr:hypothetical protein JTE90_004331 [Oedothorax gibbosus]